MPSNRQGSVETRGRIALCKKFVTSVDHFGPIWVRWIRIRTQFSAVEKIRTQIFRTHSAEGEEEGEEAGRRGEAKPSAKERGKRGKEARRVRGRKVRQRKKRERKDAGKRADDSIKHFLGEHG